MRRFALAIWVLMTVVCSACTGVRDAEQNTAINDYYAHISALETVCAVRMDHGDSVSDYCIAYRFDHQTHTLTVLEPNVLNGLTVEVGAETHSITYEGIVFAPQALSGSAVSPVRVLCDLLPTWQNGYAEAVTKEETEAGDAIVCTFTSMQTGEVFSYRVWFLQETYLPLKAECFSEGYLVMTVAFSDVAVTKLEE
ncbi:MAG: hypothetical protein IKU55_06155 [Clostridia bacterium]|nr:hypothetical protein [Clostridia bacterium]